MVNTPESKQRYRRSEKGRATEKAYSLRWNATDNAYFRRKLSRIKSICKVRGIVVAITGVYLKGLYEAQHHRCALTGRVMVLRDIHPNSLSVDRITPSKGYTKGNVRLVTWQANSARGDGTDEDLIQFCRDVLRVSGMDTPEETECLSNEEKTCG